MRLRQVGEAHALARQRRDLLDLEADRAEPRRVRVLSAIRLRQIGKARSGRPCWAYISPA
jgi:hypothetical protein